MFKLLKRSDKMQDVGKPFVSLRPSHVSFNRDLSRLADIKPGMRVRWFTDPDEFKVGFQFTTQKDNTYSVSQGSSGNFTSLGELARQEWIRAVTQLPMSQRRFVPVLEDTEAGKMWVLRLCPSFEIKRARESDRIGTTEVGIYRYKRNGEVVYIGRGVIAERLREPQRKDWEFDLVEYSRVTNPDEQAKWEYHWLEQHKEETGSLPLYNKIHASVSKKKTPKAKAS